ncbi:MAG: V-type ATPase subunit [Candidatus Bipolaricaulia bacterium]
MQMTALQDDAEFAFATGSVRFLETRLLDRTRLARLIDAADAEEAWQTLVDAGYTEAEATAEAERETYEQALVGELQAVYRFLKRVSPKPRLTDWLAQRYDFHNLKVYLKAKHLGEAATDGVIEGIGLVAAQLIEAAVSTETWEALPDELTRAGAQAVTRYEQTGSANTFDLVVDREMYAYLHSVADHPFLKSLITTWSDLVNLKTVLRTRALDRDREFLGEALVPPGSLAIERLWELFETPLENWSDELRHTAYASLIEQAVAVWQEQRSLAAYEKLTDDYLIEELSTAKLSTYGVEPLVAYVLAKEIEIKNVRIIMVGKLNEIPNEEIETRIRNSYV